MLRKEQNEFNRSIGLLYFSNNSNHGTILNTLKPDDHFKVIRLFKYV